MTYLIQVPIDIDFSLERISAVLKTLENPQDKLPPIVHVAGTNGKGSTIAFLRAVLEGEGYTVHGYTSPHMIRVNERINIAGTDISDDLLDTYIQRVRAAVNGFELSYFEELTVAAFLAFSEHPADFCLIEVGLGGRLDATNVVYPDLGIITSISYDHQNYLGETITEIAAEKAGIIKTNAPVVCAHQKYPEARDLISDKSKAMGGGAISPPTLPRAVSLGLLGEHQYDNAATAIKAAEILLGENGDRFHSHLSKARWPGRLQKLFEDHDIWVDGAHNEGGIEVLLKELQKWTIDENPIVLAVSQLSNRSEELLYPLFEITDEIYHIDMGQGNRFRGKPARAKKTLSLKEALSYFMQPEYNSSRILFTGSLYMVGEILNIREIINGNIE
ncbi:bifunctional folylpolyglutamate synthase/dihydrofolate synthase [Candidatus Odyssella acanthamoebae]|uniref:bifunctional folylpolyglutamate synthase/dihydrofolate synthase n=1 Tax=Candidatus Odyssella acanthamoebae TaxID=91604 RepID=UPI00068EB71E|nr:folylpolyglutamate synthase/dihydrofolate synthase family protein [Candidatus Paracaedibacter acanthamoebae]